MEDGGRRAHDPRVHRTGRLPAWTCLLRRDRGQRAGRGLGAGRFRLDGPIVRRHARGAARRGAGRDRDDRRRFEVPKHGIYREIPIRYAVGMQQYALRFRLLGVDDGTGRAYGTAVSYEENRVRIRIGDADRTLRGPVRYPRPLPGGAGDPLGRETRLGRRRPGNRGSRGAPLERHGNRVGRADPPDHGDGPPAPRSSTTPR